MGNIDFPLALCWILLPAPMSSGYKGTIGQFGQVGLMFLVFTPLAPYVISPPITSAARFIPRIG
jgi:hypothetical protein